MTTKFKFSPSDYLLYLLARLEPKQSGKLKLNKIAFFVEFGYRFKTGQDLSSASYAGINYGPVIHDYKSLLANMEKRGLIKIDGNFVHLTSTPAINLSKEVGQVIDPLIEKYSSLSESELVTLSHATDSYRITTGNGKKMGQIIDKKLSSLETFFDDNGDSLSIDENKLPLVNRKNLIPYEF
ncbi:MAG: type II toxin-antitoxin system antitoxin SocA domain-containing protein [Candidatus Shapirobacteria bacterium]|jgi:uncharacterized phage-associated protein